MNNIQFTLNDCKIVELPKIHNPAGNITVIQNGSNFPFAIKRVYYLYDIPCESERGGHAHKYLWQFILAASGSFIIILDDGKVRKTIQLNQPYKGLLIVPGIWREIINFLRCCLSGIGIGKI
jgi:hypothetical protein